MSSKLTPIAAITTGIILSGICGVPQSLAQTSEPPQAAPGANVPPADVPPIDVIQQQPQPKPKPKPVAQPAPAPAPQPAPAPEPEFVEADAIDPPLDQTPAQGRASGTLVPMSPLAGGEIAIEKVPGGVSTVSSEDFKRNGTIEAGEILQKTAPGIILTDAGGSPVRQQVEYRGFGAGSINGFPQGLSTYQNGIRINEVFGDTTNWDLIPSNAINDITIVSGNPVFGLNAIGGGISILMKDAWSFEGVELDVLAGSFGRRVLGAQVGQQSGPFGIYFAGQFIQEDGWRDFSEVDVKRSYTDLGYKTRNVEAHFNFTWSSSEAGVVAASPVELLEVDYGRTFTSPQTTEFELAMPSINASIRLNETLKVSTMVYYRRFKSNLIDGNLLEGEECDDVAADNGIANPFPDAICQEDLDDNGNLVPLRDAGGNLIEDDDVGEEPFGIIDKVNQKAESYGGALQLVEKAKLFGFTNSFTVGTTYDRGNVLYNTEAEIGTIGNRFVVAGSGIVVASPDDFARRSVDIDTEYVGLFFTDTIDLTSELALTVGGRYNYAKINLKDLSGNFPGITSNHTFERFNPSVGATYQLMPGLTLYGGYSEANRAPTPGELACADPENPCPIESFLTDDPPLDQVVSNTWEAGLRSRMRSANGNQSLDWSLGFFRTENTDDILFVSSTVTGRGFFFNAGDTLRQGVEASLKYRWGPVSLWAGYSYVRATFETANEFSSPVHPNAVACQFDPSEIACINVRPGDRIPGIPEHRFKGGVDFWLTSKWKVGADVIAASGQHILGDEANELKELGGYTRVDLRSSYHVSDNIEIYGFINNVFDKRYGLFGTLFEADEASEAAEPSGLGEDFFTNNRSIVPAPPVAAYAGIRMKF